MSVHLSLRPTLTPLYDVELASLLSHDTVSRIWKHDASVWTGADESKWLGWLDIAETQLSHLDKFSQLAKELREEGFTDAVVLGMGGSSLCPEVLSLTFPQGDGSPRLHILDSTDPTQIASLESRIDVARTVFFESSKSGSTLEPTIFAAYFRDRVAAVVGAEAVGRHFIAVTDPGSKVDQHAAELGYRAIFHGLPSIGGRYSALSDFGMIPGAAAGIDVSRVLHSAAEMASACRSSSADNPGLGLGTAIGVATRTGRDKLTIVASPALIHFGAWLEQLLAESTGKQGHGVVPVDLEPLGAPDAYGEDRLFVHLRLKNEPDAANASALSALESAGHPVIRIELEDVYDLGAEMFRWEFATAVAGSVIGINPFNQPDVEDAKVATRSLTDKYDESGELPDLDWMAELGELRVTTDERNRAELSAAPSVLDVVGSHLRRAGFGDYIALLAYLPMDEQNARLLHEIRTLLRDHLRVATCVGFGPRFQHSTGQAYKGGPNTGVFLQLTCADPKDLTVPGHKYTFGVVKESQARGDFAVLSDRGRRALRLDLGADVVGGLTALRNIARQLG